MVRPLALVILIAAALGTGCQNNQPVSGNPVKGQDSLASGSTATKEDTLLSGKLETGLALAGAITTDSVPLSFTVINHADTTMRFCKWETPFEPRLGKYFEITDAAGNEAPFKGAMARRVMPPPAESYIAVPAHDSVQTTINLSTNYTFTSATYTLRYSGGGVSGLEGGNEIKLTVH
jgi:hypothetical protein